jgi:hypothetical protein
MSDAKIIEQLVGLGRMDAAHSGFFARQLEHIKAQTYDIKYPTLKAREFIPVATDAPAGAETITYRQFDRVVNAKIISNNAKDLPRVEVDGKEFTRPVRTWGAAYGYTLMEIQNAAMARTNLNARKASALRRVVEEGLDETAAIGAPDHGIPSGFLNDPNVETVAAAGAWSGASSDAILDDISAACQNITDDTNGIFMASDLLLPTAQYTLIMKKRLTDSDNQTVLDFVESKYRMRVSPWYRLDDLGKMVTYVRDPEVCEQDITQEFTQLPVQEQGLEFLVHAIASTTPGR